jgi:hypothetical protein
MGLETELLPPSSAKLMSGDVSSPTNMPYWRVQDQLLPVTFTYFGKPFTEFHTYN